MIRRDELGVDTVETPHVDGAKEAWPSGRRAETLKL
jgi:hypothetical protein